MRTNEFNRDANLPPEDKQPSPSEKLAEIYKDMVKFFNTDQMLGVILNKHVTTDELVEGVKTKILTLSKN